MKKKVLLCWSGGKDSALALWAILEGGQFEVATLLTTINSEYDRVSMHGVRAELIEMQGRSLALPLERVAIPNDASNETYESRMRQTLEKHRREGVRGAVFGDVFLQDVRTHREERLAEVEMEAIFPLWGKDTGVLARDFIRLGFRGILTCVDSQMLDGRFAGREFDEQLLAELPANVDPCGENGEFHTFVYAGPLFREPIPQRRGEVVVRDSRFHFCDVEVPGDVR